MSDDLKPCPFCGGIMEMTLDEKYFVHPDKTCFGVHISIVATDFARIAAWNTRADVKRIEELERAWKDLEKLSIKLLNEKLQGEWREPLENDLAETEAKLAKALDLAVYAVNALDEIQTYEQPDDPWTENALAMGELDAFDFNVATARATLKELGVDMV